MKLFQYNWFHRTDPWTIEVFADSKEEADEIIKDEVERFGHELEGEYGPDQVCSYPVEKGILRGSSGTFKEEIVYEKSP